MFALEAPRGPETMNGMRLDQADASWGIIACDIPGFQGEWQRNGVQQHNQPKFPKKYQGVDNICTATDITEALPVAVSCPAIYTQDHPEVYRDVLRTYSPREQQMTATDQSQQDRTVTPP
jgi:hypothetical protein